MSTDATHVGAPTSKSGRAGALAGKGWAQGVALVTRGQ